MADCLIHLLRRSRRLRDSASQAEFPMIAWILFGSDVLLPKVAELFNVSIGTAAKWISDGNSDEYDALQAVGTFYDALLDQEDPQIRAWAQTIVDRLAEAADAHLRK